MATKTCSTCQRPDIAAVNADLTASLSDNGPSINSIAKKYDIAKTSLLRHRRCLDRVEPVAAQTPTVEVAPQATQTPEVVPASDRDPSFRGKPGAGRPCLVCSSEVREELERQMMAGRPWATIAREVPGSPKHDSLRHHARKCIPDLIRQAHAEGDNVQAVRIADDIAEIREAAMGLLEKVRQLVDEAQEALHAAPAQPCDTCGSSSDAGRDKLMRAVRDAATVMGRVKDTLRVVGQFSGELRDKTEIDVREARDWPRFLSAVSGAVAPCEDCSERVAAALERLES